MQSEVMFPLANGRNRALRTTVIASSFGLRWVCGLDQVLLWPHGLVSCLLFWMEND
jgi:hypothetical protein